MKQLVIYGIGSQAALAKAYFEKDSEYTVVAFTVEQAYLKETQFFGLPVHPFENIESLVSPEEADMYVAIGPVKVFSLLEKFYQLAKTKGYKLASYCSSAVKNNFEPTYGDNCFIDHAAKLHPYVKLGNCVTIQDSVIAHNVEIGNFCLISVSILGGKVILEDNVFIGMGAVVREGVRIGKGSIIGMGCLITKDVEPYSVYSTPGTKLRDGMDSRDIELFKARS